MKFLINEHQLRLLSEQPFPSDVTPDKYSTKVNSLINKIFGISSDDSSGTSTQQLMSSGDYKYVPSGPVDFKKMTKLVLDKIEGGYYNPEWHYKSAMGRSGETMFGIDRRHGGKINTEGPGVEFWNLIDKNKTPEVWKHYYDGGNLREKLIDLVTQMMINRYERLSKKWLTPESIKIVNSDGGLLFHFFYACWNGDGYFKNFAEDINKAVKNGITSPKELRKIALNSRLNSKVARSTHKIENIMNNLA
jgi:hypothetical protein